MTTSKRGNNNRRRDHRPTREDNDSYSSSEEKMGNIQHNHSELSLYEACEKGIFPVVNKLLNEGASPNGPNQAKWLPIHGAAISGHTEIVERLLREPSVDINARNPFHETALTLASCWGHIDTVRLLLSKGADVTLKDWQSRDALAFAKSMFGKTKMVELIDLLEDAIKKSNSQQPLPSKTETVKNESNPTNNNHNSNASSTSNSKPEPAKNNPNIQNNPTFNFGGPKMFVPTASIPQVPSKPSNNNNSQAKIPPKNPPPSKPVSPPSSTPISTQNNNNNEKKVHSCARCGKNKVYKKCGACQATYYCDQRCQEEDWPTHCKHCKSFAIALAAQKSGN